jgi:hypothetical protein
VKLNVYSVFDEKAGAYLQPFFMQNDNVALRAISNCLADPQHNFALNPSDYTLFLIGEWDDALGAISQTKKGIVNLLELKSGLDSITSKGGEPLQVVGGTD